MKAKGLTSLISKELVQTDNQKNIFFLIKRELSKNGRKKCKWPKRWGKCSASSKLKTWIYAQDAVLHLSDWHIFWRQRQKHRGEKRENERETTPHHIEFFNVVGARLKLGSHRGKAVHYPRDSAILPAVAHILKCNQPQLGWWYGEMDPPQTLEQA